MKTFLAALLLFACLFSSLEGEARDNRLRNRNRLHLDFVKRQHQTKIRQQHAQRGHKKGANKIWENDSLKPQKPLFCDFINFYIKISKQ